MTTTAVDQIDPSADFICSAQHPDEGSCDEHTKSTEYTSLALGKRYGEASVWPSMGSVGEAYDNAMAESFFSTVEAELLSRHRFISQAEARMGCLNSIEG